MSKRNGILSKNNLNSIWFRYIIVILTFIFLSFFFISPAIQYSRNPDERVFQELVKDSPAHELVITEHKKAIDEIQFRLKEQDEWYHYKFLIIGGMLALFLGQIEFGRRRGSSVEDESAKTLEHFFTNTGYAFLALAFVISLIIDIHIRFHMFSIQTLGLWIAHFVEPAYLFNKPTTGFYPWEQFARYYSTTDSNNSAMLFNILRRFGFSVHMHFLTIVVYLVYAISLQRVCLLFGQGKDVAARKTQKQIILFSFLLVQLALIGFVVVIHAIPTNYEMQIFPFKAFTSGLTAVAYYLIPYIILVGLNVPYLLLLREKPKNGK